MNKEFGKILERLEKYEYNDLIEHDSEQSEHCKRIDCGIGMDCSICVMEKAKEIVQEVAEEYNVGWISVKDRLPDKAGSYLVIGKSGGATVTRWYMPSEFYPQGHFGGNSSDYIRYWMHRPEPPKERD